MNFGYYFNGSSSYLLDEQSRKILCEGTTGLWSSINLEGDVPLCGSICGSGTVLSLNDGNALPPKITGKIILYPGHCPNLTRLYCYRNSISVLDVSALTLLTHLYCYDNSISVLDVSALTSLTNLNCRDNSISVLDVSALTSLINLQCGDNSISVLDVSALTSLINLQCHNNSMNQAMVDTVLCDMDGHGTSNGTLNISGNAVPSATGIACKNNLIARGWAVTTD
jgi:Leucine-rich repeat (LRR) protein